MALKKGEMQLHKAAYYELIGQARIALQDGDFGTAIQLAMSSWNYISGMLQYERRYEQRTFQSTEAVDIVLTYAPVLLHLEALDRLAVLLKSERGIDRHASDDLAGRLTQSRELLTYIHGIWDWMENRAHATEDELCSTFCLNVDHWRLLIGTWTEMGLVEQSTRDGHNWLTLAGPTRQVVRGKCPACGVVARAEKSRFLDEVTCPKCRSTVVFVILAGEPDTES
jgi:hypothetical protein